MWLFFLTMSPLFAASDANYPVFEAANQLKQLLIPADVHIGSVIYRLRASDHDHDYPLQFDATDYGSYVVKVETLACDVNATFCEANVYLDRVLVAGQNFKFRFTVRDTKGDTTTALASIEVTSAPVDITTVFPHMPGIIVIPEDTKIGTELEYVIVRKHPDRKKTAQLEIRGSSLLEFGRSKTSQETTTGVITLSRNVDFEQQNMYKLQIFALDMYTDKLVDSRNIAGFDLLLIIQDIQDSPPVFTHMEATVKLRSNLSQGDVITKVMAIDGDRGNPRPIKYGLVSEGNPFTIFFNIDRITGQVTLAKPLKELTAIARSYQPIMLTIVAEKEKLSPKDSPSMSTTITIALLLDEAGNTAPYFDNDHYVCHLNENSGQGTTLVFSDAYSTQVHDDDMGKQGIFSLTLENNNGTFEIMPNAVERKAHFAILVRNKQLLDYESRQIVQFMIVARELDPGSLSSSATVLVYLNDVNDNPPQFQKSVYIAQIPENVTSNTFVTEVKATDVDTGLAANVHYTRIVGYRNNSLMLDSITGAITIATDNHGFDREESAEYRMTIEARDMEGTGLLANTSLILRILDVNDETPVFENSQYHFTLTANLRNFSTSALIKAIDKDAEAPNNIVRYEIISGNYNNKFICNAESGELTVKYFESVDQKREPGQASILSTSNVYILTVRAYDLGVPHRWSTSQVKVFPPDSGSRMFNFVIPARGMNYDKMEELLTKLTGGQVAILEVNPYRSRFSRAITQSTQKLSPYEKNMVVARVTYPDNSVVDIEQVYYTMQNVFSPVVLQNDQAEVQTARSGTALYWIIVILILLLITLLIAVLLCYLCKCCPRSLCNKYTRHKNINQVSGSAQTVDFLNKGVQANNRVETWSGYDSARNKRNWKFYSKREADPQPQPLILIPKNTSPTHHHHPYATTSIESPAFMYRTTLPEFSSRDQHTDILMQDVPESEYRILDPSKLNIRSRNNQVNIEPQKFDSQKSEREQICEGTFVREGNVEILRLQSHDDHPKTEQSSVQWAQNMNYEVQPILIPGDTGSRNSKQTNSTLSSIDGREPTSKPEDEAKSEVELHPKLKVEKMANGILLTKMSHTALSQLEENDVKVSKELSSQSATEPISNDSETLRNLIEASHLEEERNRLASFQRDLLLTRFLVEEQRRYLNNQGSDTLSLPGSLSMATQTDRHRATQTDVLCLMRPEPRRAKSENDESSDSEVDCYTSIRRTVRVIGEGKNRHKIRTPIIEESESTEVLRHSSNKPLHRENCTNLLKSTNNQNQVAMNAKVGKSHHIILKQSKLHKSTTDITESKMSKKVNQSLTDTKKSVSYSNLNDCMLSDKEMYTPRSLKSRIIARRLIASKPQKVGGHYMSHKQHGTKHKQNLDATHPCETELSETLKEGQIGGERKLRHQQQVEDKQENMNPISRSNSRGSTEKEEGSGLERNMPTPTTGTTTLKLKNKHQQLMEKKSVFTIAYDDATTEHLGVSSNGSNHE